jgi:hypothetical protein
MLSGESANRWVTIGIIEETHTRKQII